jgi:hypothetical protein
MPNNLFVFPASAAAAPPPLVPDIFAATRVVSLIPGEGTDLTIAAAIAALPAAGGLIYVKQGIYQIAASLVPTNKPIAFVGSGAGTVIDLGANVISAFTINFDQRYSFSNLKILGSGIAGQVAFEFNIGGSSGQEVNADAVLVDNIEKTFLIAGTDFPIVHTTMCVFKVANLASSFHWDGAGEWHSTDTLCSHSGFTLRGGIANNPDLFWVNCEAVLSNGCNVNFVQLDRCKFREGTLVIAAQGGVVGDCLFDAILVARFIDIIAGAGSITVAGCQFGSFTSEAIRVASTDCFITGNAGCKLTEVGGATANRFADLVDGSIIIGATTIVTDWNTRFIDTTPVTLDITHRTVLVEADGPMIVNLPPAANAKHRVYTIKKIDNSADVVTIEADGAETIDGAASIPLAAQWEWATVQSNGTAWFRIG